MTFRRLQHGGMRLVLVHHADAVGPEVDPQRPLSMVGRFDVERLAAAAAAKGVKPAVIWHSGKLRSRQTAEAFWKACNPFAELKATRGLQPSDGPWLFRDVLAEEERDLLAVGHMPSLPRILALLSAGSEDANLGFPLARRRGALAHDRNVVGWRSGGSRRAPQPGMGPSRDRPAIAVDASRTGTTRRPCARQKSKSPRSKSRGSMMMPSSPISPCRLRK